MTNFNIIKRLFKYSKGFRKNYIAALLINAFTMIRFSFLIGFSIKWVTDSAIAGDWPKLKKALLFALIAFLINAVLYFLEGYLMITSVERMTAEMEKELIKRVMHLHADYLSSKHSGDLQSRLTSDLSLASDAISFTLVDPINFGALGIVNLSLIGFISWKMAIICLGLVIAVVFMNAVFLKPIEESSSKIQNFIAGATEKYLDIIRGIPIIKIFNLQQWVFTQYDKESKGMLSWQRRLNRINSSQKAFNEFVNSVCTFGILAIGALYLVNGEITTGALFAIARYTSTLVFAFTGFGVVLSEVVRSIEGAKRVMQILDLPIEENKINFCKSQPMDKTILNFEHFSFQYEEGKTVIEDFNETINKGEVIALVGPSGTGKTTIMKHIMGLCLNKGSHGKINLYGRDINEYSLDERRGYISYVPQNSYLFSGTIRDNISFGKPSASEEDIINVAKAANAHDFIMRLPKGYDSEVGEAGSHLSGGERQRIAIARALLKDAPIILLDEPTASIDSLAEKEIQQALDILVKDKTVIVAAHRLSTIQNADRIIVLEEGKIVEKNTHDELMKLNARYAYYYRLLYN